MASCGRTVLVDLSVALTPAPSAGFRRDTVSMRTKTAGLDNGATAPDLLHAWARTTGGTWIGLVQTAILGRARLLGISRTTLYKYIPELTDKRESIP